MKQLLSDALDDYSALRSSQDFSRRTLANEKGILKRFLLVTGNIYFSSITERHVTRYFEEASKTRGPGSLQIDHTTLVQLFDWAHKTRRLTRDVDPMAGRRRPKARKRERVRLPVSKFPAFLDRSGKDDPRNRMVAAMLLYTLARDNEVCGVRLGDLMLEEGYIRMTISKTYTEDMVPICSELDEELRQWLTYYHQHAPRPLTPTDYLLPGRTTERVLRSSETGRIAGHEFTYQPHLKMRRLASVVGPTLEAFGIAVKHENGKSTREGAHTLRRSGARALFDRLAAEGYDRALRIVQSMLHHSSVQTTEIYIGITADERSRDEILRGQVMFPVVTDNVLALAVGSAHGNRDGEVPGV